MKKLTVVRHAKSSWDEPGLRDHERPLGARGLRDAPKTFKRYEESDNAVDAIVSSDAVRARSTAEIFATALAMEPDEIRLEPRLYLASAREILEIVRAFSDSFVAVAIVGHNPGFTDVINRTVADARLDNLPTSGIACIAFNCASWAEASSDCARLTYLDYPKNRAAPLTWD